jgi:hypothetical protein
MNSTYLFKGCQKSEKRSFGADVIVPALMYLVIKTNPPQLLAHVAFIQRYGRQQYLQEGSFGFCNTNLASVIGYIQSIDVERYVTKHELASVADGGKPQLEKFTPIDYVTDNVIADSGKKVLFGAFNVLNSIVTTPAAAISGGTNTMWKGFLKWDDSRKEQNTKTVVASAPHSNHPPHDKFSSKKWEELTMSEIPELLAAYQRLFAEHHKVSLSST